jgi:hypothetical protein
MSDLPPPVENALRLSQASISTLSQTLKQYSEVTQSQTGAEILQALDCVWISAERLRLELAIAAGDIVFEDETDEAPIEAGHE